MLGISVMVFAADDLFQRFGVDYVRDELDIFVKQQNLQMFGMMTSQINETTKEFEKSLLLYSPNLN
jgi:hypothetical protein